MKRTFMGGRGDFVSICNIAENVKWQFDIFSVPIFFCCATFEKFILLSVCVAKWLRKVYSFTRAERMQWQNLTLYIMLLRPEKKASPRVSNSRSVNQHNEAWKITYEVVFLDILISLDNIEGEPESTVTQLSALSGESRKDNFNFLNWVFFIFDLCK